MALFSGRGNSIASVASSLAGHPCRCGAAGSPLAIFAGAGLPGCRSEIASSRYWRWFALDQDRSPVIWLVFAMRCPVKIVLHRGRSCPTFTTQTTDGKICARCSIGWAWTQLRSRMDALPATFVPRLAVVSPAVRIKPARSGSCMRRNGSIGRRLSVPMQSFSRACMTSSMAASLVPNNLSSACD